MLRLRSAAGAFLLAMFLAGPALVGGCSRGDGEQAQGSAGHGGPGAGAAGGARDEQPPVPVAAEVSTAGSISSYYTATATLAAEKEAEILARVAGVVGTLGCEEGDQVREGALLLTIENEEYKYRLAQAEANRADLQSRLKRLESMRVQELVSAEAYESLINSLKAAQAEEGLARTSLSYTQVTAPFTGRIVARRVDLGQNVNGGTPLFALADFDPLLARVHVPAKQFNLLKPDQVVDLVLESTMARLKGRVKLVSPTIDPASGTIKVTIEIAEYPAGTRPGDFAQVSIVTERRNRATLVPKIALVTDRSEQVVFVAAADSTAERRVVEVGFQDDVNAQILDGIAVGERVIVKGQRSLKHGARIKILAPEVAADSTERAGS